MPTSKNPSGLWDHEEIHDLSVLQNVPLGTLQKIKAWRDECLVVQEEKKFKELKRQGIRMAMEFKVTNSKVT
jgi:hypothetical protein